MIDIQQLWRDAYMTQLARTANPTAARAAADHAVEDFKAANPCPPAGELVPIYRLRNGDHYLYTASEAEKDSAITAYGYVLEGVAFCAYRAPWPPP